MKTNYKDLNATKKPEYYYLLAFFSSALFLVVSIVYSLDQYRSFCTTNFDFGLYLQAMKDFSWKNLNPYLLSLNTYFLNDHWHPGLLLGLIPSVFFPLSTSLLLTEIFFFLFTSWVPFLLVKKNQLHLSSAVFINIYLLLNYYQWKALFFPVHPAVWANFFLILASFFVTKSERKYGLAFFMVFLSSFFGEQFSLALLGFSLAMIFSFRKYFVSFLCVLFSLVWVWFLLSGRAYILGPIIHQTERIAVNPLEILKKYNWDLNHLKSMCLFLGIHLPFFYFLRKKMYKKDWFDLLPILGIFAPLVLGRILSGSFHFHYDSLLICAVASLAMVLFRKHQIIIPYRSLVFSLLFFLLFSYSKFRWAYYAVVHKESYCVHVKKDASLIFKERMQNLENAMAMIKQQGGTQIFVSDNLAPNFLEAFPDASVYTVGSVLTNQTKTIDWVVLEHGRCGDSWRIKYLKDENLNALMKAPGLKVLKHTGDFSLFQGPISSEVL